MCKITNFSVNNQEKSEKFHSSTEKNFKIEANADAMTLSSYGGLLLLRQEESPGQRVVFFRHHVPLREYGYGR